MAHNANNIGLVDIGEHTDEVSRLVLIAQAVCRETWSHQRQSATMAATSETTLQGVLVRQLQAIKLTDYPREIVPEYHFLY